jgi:isoquinoline 1-oxidoreductase subunit beta
MELLNKSVDRRSFIKASAITGGGFMLNISWLAKANAAEKLTGDESLAEWSELNAYIKITPDNIIKIMAPNPEFGSNVKTSLPMMAAEELDADWSKVVVEQAFHNNALFGRQFTGGSMGVASYWNPMRNAGASARYMLVEAAAQTWGVPAAEITTSEGMLKHPSGKSATYGEMATKAAGIVPPKDLKLKDKKDYKIIRTSRKNVAGKEIVTGKPIFSLDYDAPGTLIAMVERPPAFGMKLKSFDATQALKMPGIVKVFKFNVFDETYERGSFDTIAFNELVAIVGNSTWEVMNARKKLSVQWEPAGEQKRMMNVWGRKMEVVTPGPLESTDSQMAAMAEWNAKPAKELRKDGDPETAFKNAATVIERTYNAPFLAHNCMEPMNCFAHVTAESARIVVPIQAPELTESALVKRLGLPADKIEIELSRMGGGFGRRAYGHYLIEAAVISKESGAPIKMIYTREDDMSNGVYRPMYTATYRAALDADKKLIAFAVKGGGVPEHPVHANRFPAGAVDNYLAEGWEIPSNVTIGAFRAPKSNFNAAAEQSFLDEVAEAMGKDPIDLRLELLQRATDNPVGKNNDYNAARYAEVIKLVRDKAGWGKAENSKYHRGVAAYFCHNSYAAHVVDMVTKDGEPYIERVTSAVDCGIVINPDAAKNMIQGAVVDGIGSALYGSLTMKDGEVEQRNFNTYRMIRHFEAPKSIDVHFVASDANPTGLGEPPYPPVFGAVASAMYRNTGKRYYNQPFTGEQPVIEVKS